MSDPGAEHVERFRVLYTDHVEQITGYALRRVGSADDAADVVAETFLVAWRRTLDLPAGEEARLWLYGVARRVLASHRRSVVRRERLGWRLRDALGERAVVRDTADEVVEIRAVRSVLDRLRDVDREVLLLSAWEQLEPREIARVLELSPDVVRTRLRRARSRLREQLSPAQEDAPGTDSAHPTRLDLDGVGRLTKEQR